MTHSQRQRASQLVAQVADLLRHPDIPVVDVSLDPEREIDVKVVD